MIAAAVGLSQAPAWGNGSSGAAVPANLSGTAPEAGTGQDDPERQRLFSALDRWMNQTRSSYSYDIESLQDPFLPIKEVRGEDPGKVTPSAFTQLKLVAIIKHKNDSAFLASFEDGVGRSHILHAGDTFGPKKERILKISETTVTVEEPAGESGQPSRINEIKLLVQGTAGMTRSSEEAPVD